MELKVYFFSPQTKRKIGEVEFENPFQLSRFLEENSKSSFIIMTYYMLEKRKLLHLIN